MSQRRRLIEEAGKEAHTAPKNRIVIITAHRRKKKKRERNTFVRTNINIILGWISGGLGVASSLSATMHTIL